MDDDDVAIDADELERLASESDAEFATFLEEINAPLNALRKIAGKQPRSVPETAAAVGPDGAGADGADAG